MQAVVFADRQGAELAPLCEMECPALLSLANRPLLQYTIEDLAAAGVDDILLVVSDNAAQIEALFGDGAMWGVSIRYLLSRGEEPPQRLLARFASLLKPPFLAARGDVLRTAACTEMLAAAASLTDPAVDALNGRTPTGLCLVRQWPTQLPQLAWPLDDQTLDHTSSVQLGHALFAALDSLADFHRAALRLAGPDMGYPDQPGVDIVSGLRVGRLSRINPTSRVSGHITVGEQTWVNETARLSGPCVVGSDCYIDRGVQISNSVVMPGSYIGENLQVENAIVINNYLIRVDLDTVIDIDEPQLLSANGSDIADRLRQWPDRVIGATLLILSLPLWPLALLVATLATPRAPLTRRPVLSNRCQARGTQSECSVVSAWQFATRVPLLRHLPMLSLVARGDLRLFGARPSHAGPTTVPGATGERRAAKHSAGLLGPAVLYLSPDAPDEEIRLCELEFVANTRFSSLLSRMISATRLLFSTRAWWPAQKTLGGA
jgi:NDP-sugar pyrophosphorylase family protein